MGIFVLTDIQYILYQILPIPIIELILYIYCICTYNHYLSKLGWISQVKACIIYLVISTK